MRSGQAEKEADFLPSIKPTATPASTGLTVEPLVVALGWVGMGIGLAELWMTRALAQSAGLKRTHHQHGNAGGTASLWLALVTSCR